MTEQTTERESLHEMLTRQARDAYAEHRLAGAGDDWWEIRRPDTNRYLTLVSHEADYLRIGIIENGAMALSLYAGLRSTPKASLRRFAGMPIDDFARRVGRTRSFLPVARTEQGEVVAPVVYDAYAALQRLVALLDEVRAGEGAAQAGGAP